ncbi:MAG: c-type cytochrome [Gemmatimonadota bacterium]
MRLFLSAVGITLVSAAPSAFGGQESPPPSPPRSVMVGVYTPDQATRGRSAHRTHCTSCHGTTNYSGEAFEKLFVGSTVFDMFDRLRTTMPEDNPGIVPVPEYIDIIAYILSVNGYPQGESELKPDEADLRSIAIDSAPPRK